MRSKESIVIFGVVSAVLFVVFDGLIGKAGNLNPSGPPGSTMVTLEQISSQIDAISSPVNKVVRGVITFDKWAVEQTRTLPLAVDPNHCVVLLSDAVALNPPSDLDNNWISRTGACLTELTGTQIKVCVEARPAEQKVSYQIIEYR